MVPKKKVTEHHSVDSGCFKHIYLSHEIVFVCVMRCFGLAF